MTVCLFTMYSLLILSYITLFITTSIYHSSRSRGVSLLLLSSQHLPFKVLRVCHFISFISNRFLSPHLALVLSYTFSIFFRSVSTFSDPYIIFFLLLNPLHSHIKHLWAYSTTWVVPSTPYRIHQLNFFAQILLLFSFDHVITRKCNLLPVTLCATFVDLINFCPSTHVQDFLFTIVISLAISNNILVSFFHFTHFLTIFRWHLV